MTREEANKALPILQAFAEGKVIQMLDDRSIWTDLTEREGLPIESLREETNSFRIKPESKYRPFKDAEECWKEMLKHQQFGWVKDNDCYYDIVSVSNRDVSIVNLIGDIIILRFSDAMEDYTFVDGLPFGILEEE